MKSLLETNALAEALQRLEQLSPETKGQWGKMDVAQMMAHVSNGLELAMGEPKPPRSLMGRLIGNFFKTKAFDDSPLPRNTPTDNSIRVTEPKLFLEEKARLSALLAKFNEGGVARVTNHPHFFFGSLTPEEWGKLQYKHLSYHFGQFGV